MKRLIKLVISIFVYSFDYLFNKLNSLFNMEIRRFHTILYYHHVSELAFDNFVRQIKFFSNEFLIVPLEYQDIPEDKFLNLLSITFDDGFEKTIIRVSPVFDAINIPWTVFVPSGYLGKIAGWTPENGNGEFKVISTPTLKRISGNPLVTIGSHCVTHRPVTTLPLPEAKEEISVSKRDLQDITSRTIDFLSFPHGKFSELHSSIAYDIGYRKIFGIQPTVVDLNSNVILGRVRIDPEDWFLECKLKAAGAYRWMAQVSSYKQVIKRIFKNERL